MGEKEKRAFAFHLKTNEVPAHMMRETVSRAVRESRVFKDKLKPIEPVDYETYILQKRSTINNDPLRSMVMFPYDDVSASTIPRQLRTTRSTVPENAVKEASTLFVKECINSYTTEWKVINNKYHNYSGGFTDLQPSRLSKKEDLPDQKYEVDETDESRSEDSLLSPSGQTIKQGFLYKTPFGSRSDSGFMKTYRRRFFYLNQLADKSFLLEYHKDEHSVSSKGQVFLDSLVEVTKTSKQRKYGLELKMSDKAWYIAAETDADMQEWYNALHQVLDQQKADANADKQSISSMDDLDTSEYADGDPNSSPDKTDFLAGLEKSKHPELQKYAKENERTNAQRRKEHRLNPFVLYPRMQIGSKSNHEPDSKPYEEEFGKRIIVEFSELKFRLAAHINEQGEPVEGSERNPSGNIEPFFTSLALYDAKNNKKISEDLHIDINDPVVRGYLDRGGLDIPNGSGSSEKEKERRFSTLPDISDLNEEWLKYPKKGIFSVRQPNADIYLVVRIDKILQGNIPQCTDPYLKTGDLVKNCQKVMKSAKVYCSRTTQYRMPFAWAARRMFHELTGDIDMKASFSPIYRQESTKLTNDDLLKYLQDLRRNPEKLSKLTEIPGSISVYVEPFTRMLSNCLTSSLVPTMPWPSEPTEPPTLEVEEFTPESGNVAHPFTTYTNNIYVCPINLKYDGQKAYTKARNIAVCVEFRDCDDLDAKPVKCIYGRPGQSVFTTSASLPVLHHSQSPDFYEELKIAIPTQVCPKHHLLFRFYHVSCEMGKGTVKKKDIVDSFVGYAWLPLLDHGRINCGEVSVGVSSNLPAGYLDAKSMGLGKTIGPDVRWVDNGKPLLKVRLKLVSTVYTEAPHLHNFFAICESWGGTGSNALEVIQCVKAMHAVETHTLIHFLPVILNELFHLLPITLMDEVQLNVVRLMTFIVTQVHKVNRDDVLRSYVKYVFETERESEHKKTVHEELVKNLGVLLRSTHDATVIKNLLKHLWFFFSVLTKSMAQTLIMQDKLKAPRHSRFSTQFETNLRNLVTYLMPIILKKYNEHAQEAKEANSHLANFIKSCFTYMDRGFVFRLINCYLDHFDPNDPKPFFEMKFDLLRIICNHEHYIALNLPLQKKGQQTNRPIKANANAFDLTFIYQLTEEFCQNHFLTGLLLREVGMAIHDVTEVRQHGIKVLRNLLCKHSMDDRYSSKQHQSRIAILYLPLLSIILENAPRLVKETPANTPAGSVASVDTSFEGAGSLSLERHSSISDSSDRNSVSYSQKTRSLQRDSTVLDIIAGRGSTPEVVHRSGSRKSANSANRLSWSSTSGSPGEQVVMRGGSRNKNSANRLSWSSGQAAPKISTPQPINDKEKMGSSQSLSSTTNDLKVTMNGHAGEGDKVDGLSPKPGHVRNKSTIMYDKLLDHEIKDLLVCFLYVIKNSNEDVLLGWWSRAPEEEQVQFFEVLELCLRHFQYLGKKQIVAARLREKPTKSSEERSQTLPVSRSRAMQTRSLVGGELPFVSMSIKLGSGVVNDIVAALSEAEASHRITQEANMANEIGLIVLDVLGLYCTHFKALLDGDDGDNPLMRKVLDIFLSYLQLGQSETLQKHAFASLRAFVNKFPVACFKGSATLCADICLAMLKCLNSRLASTRSEACALLYLLMRNNFEFTQRKEFIRVHLQVIISVSKLIGEANSARFQESLALVNNYANSDRSMQHTSFPSQVKDLTKKIRTVLMATAQMKEHENDPEMLVDLQYSLAKSYASTPELRRTWLDSMARIHIDHGNYSEAAHCWIHIAALIAEYLRRNKGSYPQGCSAFKQIGPNIESEEKGMKDDTGMHDVVYSEQTLIDQLEQCTEGLQKAERYETMSEVYKLLIPFYERNRNFWRLAIAYGKLSEAYKTVMAVQHSGRRLLGQYFRVAFFGQHFEEDDGKVYIYKEPKVTALSDICHRLHSLYNDKYGAENVKLIQDSKKVNPEELDSAMAYIQITYVKPYFDDKELESRQTTYERSNNIRRFVYETPYTQDSNKPRTEKVEEQFKRKTIVTTGHAFPYVKKRILVVYVQQQELNPIQVAIDELKAKVHEMNDVLKVDKPDMKRLQLLLQGSVSVTVNAGPQAYAAAFLGKDCERKWKSQLVWELKQLFRQFVQVCGQSLEVNAKLIKSDQHEYHDDLVLNYKSMVANLSQLMMEKISDEETWQVSRRASGHIFNAISGTP